MGMNPFSAGTGLVQLKDVTVLIPYLKSQKAQSPKVHAVQICQMIVVSISPLSRVSILTLSKVRY